MLTEIKACAPEPMLLTNRLLRNLMFFPAPRVQYEATEKHTKKSVSIYQINFCK